MIGGTDHTSFWRVQSRVEYFYGEKLCIHVPMHSLKITDVIV